MPSIQLIVQATHHCHLTVQHDVVLAGQLSIRSTMPHCYVHHILDYTVHSSLNYHDNRHRSSLDRSMSINPSSV